MVKGRRVAASGDARATSRCAGDRRGFRHTQRPPTL